MLLNEFTPRPVQQQLARPPPTRRGSRCGSVAGCVRCSCPSTCCNPTPALQGPVGPSCAAHRAGQQRRCPSRRRPCALAGPAAPAAPCCPLPSAPFLGTIASLGAGCSVVGRPGPGAAGLQSTQQPVSRRPAIQDLQGGARRLRFALIIAPVLGLPGHSRGYRPFRSSTGSLTAHAMAPKVFSWNFVSGVPGVGCKRRAGPSAPVDRSRPWPHCAPSLPPPFRSPAREYTAADRAGAASVGVGCRGTRTCG